MAGGKGKSAGGKSSGGKVGLDGKQKQQSHSTKAGLQVRFFSYFHQAPHIARCYFRAPLSTNSRLRTGFAPSA